MPMSSTNSTRVGTASALDTALDALELGFSPLPPVEDGTKRPLADIPGGEENGKQHWTWKPYCQTPATRQKIRQWFKGDRQSIGLVTGFDGLECFEFDCPETHKRFLEAATAIGLGELVDKIRAGYEEKTPGLGYHWLYYCAEPRGNQKLAERPDPIDAHKRIPLIETRGEGGFVIIAPSKGKVHPSGGAYELLSGGLNSIVTLTSEERESLWHLACTFDELPLVEEVKPPPQSISRKPTDPDIRPGDDYEARSTWEDLLEPLGWVRVFTRGDATYWRRPGKAEGVSATTGHCKGLYVFSTSTSFEARTSYSKFGAYARLHHGGDHHAAAKALSEAGYGSQPNHNASGKVARSERPIRKANLIRFADIQEKEVDWLWYPRLPLGMVCLFAGPPKVGKTFVTIAIAAAVSRGAGLPLDEPRAPGSVIILSAEDDPAKTLKPRLRAAGADMSKVHFLKSVLLEDGTEALPSLRADLEAIESAARNLGDCKLISIDPISAYLNGVDDHKNAEIRALLYPLNAMAASLNCVIILVTHLNKSSTQDAQQRVTGSVAYVAACRANFLFVKDKDDPNKRRRLMLDNGCNLTEEVPTLGYRIADSWEGSQVEWEQDALSITVEEAMAEQPPETTDENTEVGECKGWLKDALSQGPVLAEELLAKGRTVGFSERTMRRAKKGLGVDSERSGFRDDASWKWVLPRKDTAFEDGQRAPVDGQPF